MNALSAAQNKKIRHHPARLAALGLLLAFAWPGAQAKNIDNLLSLSLDELMAVKVNSPSLTSESLSRTPAAITVFTRDEIHRLGYDYLHELLNLVPGFQVIRSPDGFVSVSSRGRANATTAPEILVLMDGVPRNDPRGGGAANLLGHFPLVWIERVEVIRGPGSALYGENAFTGVINIITRKQANEIALQAGSHDRVQIHGLGHLQSGRWQMDGFVRAEKDNGDRYNVPNSFRPTRVNTSDPIRNLDLGASLANQDTRISLDYIRREHDKFYYSETVADDVNEFTSDYLSLHLEQQVRWLDQVDSRVLAGWQQLRWDYWVQGTGAGDLLAISTPPGDQPLIANGKTRSSVWEVFWKNDWSPSDHYGFQFGADWRKEFDNQSDLISNYDLEALYLRQFPVPFDSTGNIKTEFSDEDSRRVAGIWLQYQQQLAKPTRLTLSVRHDRYSDVDNRTSPRLALVHQLTEQQNLKLLYAEAFRAPTLYELTLRNNSRVIGNPDLQHEVVKTWDVIWRYGMESGELNLGWFHNRYEDPIVQVVSSGTRMLINGPDESSEGVELAARWSPLRELRLGASVTRFTDLPATAFREAETLGSLQLNYSQDRWMFDLAAVYRGEREMLVPTPGQILVLGDYWQLNAKLLYDLGHKAQWWVQAKNLLDETYESPNLGDRLSEGMPNRGRELALGIQWQY